VLGCLVLAMHIGSPLVKHNVRAQPFVVVAPLQKHTLQYMTPPPLPSYGFVFRRAEITYYRHVGKGVVVGGSILESSMMLEGREFGDTNAGIRKTEVERRGRRGVRMGCWTW